MPSELKPCIATGLHFMSPRAQFVLINSAHDTDTIPYIKAAYAAIKTSLHAAAS